MTARINGFILIYSRWCLWRCWDLWLGGPGIHALILAAVFCGTVMVASAIVPVGFVAFPLLFAAWRKWPGKGLGFALLAALAVFIPVLYWRTPHNSCAQRSCSQMMRGFGLGRNDYGSARAKTIGLYSFSVQYTRIELILPSFIL